MAEEEITEPLNGLIQIKVVDGGIIEVDNSELGNDVVRHLEDAIEFVKKQAMTPEQILRKKFEEYIAARRDIPLRFVNIIMNEFWNVEVPNAD